MRRLPVVILAVGLALCGVGWGLCSLAISVLLDERQFNQRGELWPTGMRDWQ